MTRDEILNMPAGREMDITVSYHVMDLIAHPKIYPNYSTNMDDAWKVVEHLTNKGYCPGLLFDDNGHWTLALEGAQSIAVGDDTVDVSTAFFIEKNLWCDTAPLAICRAALLAVMELE